VDPVEEAVGRRFPVRDRQKLQDWLGGIQSSVKGGADVAPIADGGGTGALYSWRTRP